MNTTLLLCFLAAVTMNAEAQVATTNRELYRIAFQKYIDQIDSFYAKHGDRSADSKTIYLEESKYLDSIPKSMNGRHVVIVTYHIRDSIFKAGNKYFYEVIVRPIKLSGDQIQITFSPYRVTRIKKHRFSYELSDWTIICFQFDCSSKKWVYTQTKNGGI